MSEDPIQIVEQDILNDAITADEKLAIADPVAIQTPSIKTKAELAYEIWESHGSVMNDPLTLNNWLEAEVLIESQSPVVNPTE